MTIPSGLEAHIGFGDESTYGTAVARTRFLEFVSEDIHLDRGRIASRGIRAGRRHLHRRKAGVQRVVGGAQFELGPEGMGLLLEHAIGSVNTTGASDPFTHTITPGSLTGKGLTTEVVRPDVAGAAQDAVYNGCKVTEWGISANVGDELVMASFQFWGVGEDTSGTATATSYPTGFEPFSSIEASLTSDGAAVPIRSFDLTVNNGLAVDRHFMRSTNPEQGKEPLEAVLRSLTGTLSAEWSGLTEYNHFVNLDDVTLVLTLDRGETPARSLTLTFEVQFDGNTPSVQSTEEIQLPIAFTGYHPSSDASALTAVLVNGDSAP